jgi:hypothetical protein
MRVVVEPGTLAVMPDPSDVLHNRGMPDASKLPTRVRALLDEAMRLLEDLAEPRGIFDEVSEEEFTTIYTGEGGNAPHTPLAGIYTKATDLALYAATLGQPVSMRIDALFRDGELAIAYMLDACASEAAASFGELLGERFVQLGNEASSNGSGPRSLAYSPGYCGWHVSGQGRLFDRLQPEEIGIVLNSSYLMQPLKSVSGVLVAGPGRIHRFRANFPFCEACQTHECRERIASVLKHKEAS